MPGDLVHVEIPAKDGDRARAFYSDLLGWKFGGTGMEGTDYCMTENSKPIVAVYTDAEAQRRGPMMYFAVDDIDKAVAKARASGGTADDKQPIPGQGWFARCVDTEGNAFNLFKEDRDAPMPAAEDAPVGVARA